MVKYKLIGSGVTDEHGVARMTKNAQGESVEGYVGIGAGELDIVASLDNPIITGSLVSGTYEVLDCIAYDKALSGDGNHNDMYAWLDKFIRGSDGTEFKNTSWNSAYIKNGNSNNWDNTGLAVKFNVLSVSGSGETRVNIYDGTTTNYYSITSTGIHLFTIEDGNIKHFIDGTEITDDRKTYDNSVSTFSVSLSNTNSERIMKFKDMQVYPI